MPLQENQIHIFHIVHLVISRTTQIPGRSKFFHGKISDVLNTKIKISFDRKEIFS